MTIQQIKNGQMNGKIIWVSDYRDNGNPFEKPIRKVKPTKVMVMSNETLPKNKSIYYSESHFVKLKKDGSPSKAVIPVFDNTGYRSYPGIPLNVFEREEECVESYNSQVEEIYKKMSLRLSELKKEIGGFIKENRITNKTTN